MFFSVDDTFSAGKTKKKKRKGKGRQNFSCYPRTGNHYHGSIVVARIKKKRMIQELRRRRHRFFEELLARHGKWGWSRTRHQQQQYCIEHLLRWLFKAHWKCGLNLCCPVGFWFACTQGRHHYTTHDIPAHPYRPFTNLAYLCGLDEPLESQMIGSSKKTTKNGAPEQIYDTKRSVPISPPRLVVNHTPPPMDGAKQVLP